MDDRAAEFELLERVQVALIPGAHDDCDVCAAIEAIDGAICDEGCSLAEQDDADDVCPECGRTLYVRHDCDCDDTDPDTDDEDDR